MKCSKCSAEVPNQARFCMKCGTAVTIPASAAPRPASPQHPAAQTRPFASASSSSSSSKAKMGVAALVLLLLGAGGAALYLTRSGKLVQAPGEAKGGGLVQAPGEGKSGGLVQAPAASPQGSLAQAPGESKKDQRPIEVEDYLKFLKQIEASKQRLIRAQTGEALGMMTMAKALGATIEENQYNDSFKQLNTKMNYHADAWNQLAAQLQSRVPPAACRELHDKYYDHLGKVQALIMEVNDAMNSVASNPQDALSKLSQLQGKASIDVDEAIRKSDDALADVCEKYGIRKDFDVRGDSGSSSSLLR